MSNDPLRVIRSKSLGRYVPVGVAFTWGLRYLAYEVVEHRIAPEGVQYRLAEHYCESREPVGSTDVWATYSQIKAWLREPHAISADSLDQLWEALDDEDLS